MSGLHYSGALQCFATGFILQGKFEGVLNQSSAQARFS